MAKKDDLTAEGLDKVRDILFGQQSRDSDRRLARLEEKLARDLAEVRADMLKRLESLEAWAKAELAADGQALASFQQEIRKQVEDLAAATDKRSTALAQSQDKGLTDLREQLLGQSSALRDELAERTTELSASVEAELDDVRGAKVDKLALSALLADLALRLGNEAGDDG